jgi:hypothetical protein
MGGASASHNIKRLLQERQGMSICKTELYVHDAPFKRELLSLREHLKGDINANDARNVWRDRSRRMP